MKISFKTGRGSAKGGAYKAMHLDRKFDLDKASHIDAAKTKENVYIVVDHENRKLHKSIGVCETDFTEHEKKYYEQHFKNALDKTNANYIKNRHQERCKTIDDIYKSTKTCPEELILQIGKKEQTRSIPQQTYIEACKRYLQWQAKEFPNVKILDAAIHFDEKSPHIHMRQVWQYTDEHGLQRIGQNKALDQMEIQRPDISRPQDRYNNAKITYSTACRNQWRNICLDLGLEIDEIQHTGNYSRTQNEIRAENLANDIKQLEQEKLFADKEKVLQAYQMTFGTPREMELNDMMTFMRNLNALNHISRQQEQQREQEWDWER